MTEEQWETKVLLDDWYVIKMKLWEENSCGAAFEVYEIEAQDIHHADGRVEEYKLGDKLLHGMIKWDGCADFKAEDGFHWCGLDYVRKFNNMFHELYKLAFKIIKNADREMMGLPK